MRRGWGVRAAVAGLFLAAGWARASTETGGVIRCDVAVIGGGSGGFGAALAAARMGVDVVLVERGDRLGGNSVRSGVTCWEMGAGGTGIPFDLYRRLKAHPGAVGIYTRGRHMSTFDPAREAYRYPGGENLIDPSQRYADTLQRWVSGGPPDGGIESYRRRTWHGVVFEPDAMAGTMLEMLHETGRCRVMLNTTFASVQGAPERIHAAVLSDGRRLVAGVYIDATGDGTVCAAAGCEMMAGQEARAAFDEPGAPEQPTTRINGVTLIYRVSPIASSGRSPVAGTGGPGRLEPGGAMPRPTVAATEDERRNSREPGVEPLPKGVPTNCWWASRFPSAAINQYPNGDLNVNMLPTMDGAEFLKRGHGPAMEECRRRVAAHWRHVQTTCAEFQGFRLSWVAPAPGIRESRRVVGEYVLTQRDLLAGIGKQAHPDIICIADHSMDTHGGHKRAGGELPGPYGVPYRCLVPRGCRNLLVACRAASFSSIAASSCRLSRTMMQLGQAAGAASALARELGVDLPDVPPDRLRAALRAQHVQLDHPMPVDLAAHLAERD